MTFALDSDDGGWPPRLAEEGFIVFAGQGLPAGPWCGSLIDGYGFSDEDARALHKIAPPLVVLDDLMSPPSMADLIVNPGVENFDYVAPALLGPRYALVDHRFRGLPPILIKEEVQHVVVTFGRHDASDATGLTLKALALLTDTHGFRSRVSVVLGSSSPNLDDIRAEIVARGEEVRLLIDHRNMPELLRSADIVIGAGGISLFERMACGIPSVTLCLAPNQAANIDLCARRDATTAVGSIQNQTANRLATEILSLAKCRDTREKQSRSGQLCVDGRGPDRVAESMMRLAQGPTNQVESL